VILAEHDNYKNYCVKPSYSIYGTYSSAVFAKKESAELFLTNALEAYCNDTIRKQTTNHKHITVDDLLQLSQKYSNQSELSESEGPFVLKFTVLKKRRRTDVNVIIETNTYRKIQSRQIRKAIPRAVSLSLMERAYIKTKEAFCFLLCAKRLGLYKEL
jgi:hypothetical protein